VIVEHKNCSEAKRQIGGKADPKSEGVCVVRVNRQQSEQFEAATRPYLRYAVPLSSYSMENPDRRPDGKACRVETTDQDVISLIWTSAEGTKIAPFYTGCDKDEFAKFYAALRRVSETLPIQRILAAH
jgi:hypothetical protein